MKGGQKTVGQIYKEAVAQLKENYFQHVGATGIFYAALMLFSSILVAVVFVFYFIMLFSMIPASISMPLAGVAAYEGDAAAAMAGVLAPLLIMLLVMLVLFFVMAIVSILVSIATSTAQVSVQKAVLILVRGDRLTWQAVWGDFRKNWKRYLGISAWTLLWVTLWSLLLYVPGVVKSFSYSMAPYLLIEYPDLTVRQALRKSIEVTDGHKGKLFLITLIMLGFTAAASIVASWGLFYAQIAALIVWIYPLYFAMLTIAYMDLKQAAIEKGLLPNPAPAEDEYPVAKEGDQAQASDTPGQHFTELEDDSPQL